MASDHVLHAVLDELAAPAADQTPDWSEVLRRVDAGRSSSRLRLRPGRVRLLAAALAALIVVGVGVALAAVDVLQGPPAPPENDKALRQLFPPLRIGPATELASHGGRTLFGARTERGGYCFSTTSPMDPEGEGGHCVSNAEADVLDRGGVVAIAMSGSSAGGYAAGADHVRITGAGIDVEVPVSGTGWWVGEARLKRPPLPARVEQATVVATAFTNDGTVAGRDPLLYVRRIHGPAGDVYSISFV